MDQKDGRKLNFFGGFGQFYDANPPALDFRDSLNYHFKVVVQTVTVIRKS